MHITMAKPDSPVQASKEALAMGQRIQNLRMACALSQEELSEASGLGQTTISRLERGITAKPALADLQSIARALKVPLSSITGENAVGDVDHSDPEAASGTRLKPLVLDASVVAQLSVAYGSNRELPNWKLLLAGAMRDRPQYEPWVWHSVGEAKPWLRAPMTIGAVVALADFVAQHETPYEVMPPKVQTGPAQAATGRKPRG